MAISPSSCATRLEASASGVPLCRSASSSEGMSCTAGAGSSSAMTMTRADKRRVRPGAPRNNSRTSASANERSVSATQATTAPAHHSAANTLGWSPAPRHAYSPNAT